MINAKLFAILVATMLVILAVALGVLYYAHEGVAMQQQITHAANERQKGAASFQHAARPATEAAPAVQNPWAQPKH